MFASRVADGLSPYLLKLRPLSCSVGAIEFSFTGSARSIKNPAGLFNPIATLYLTDSAGRAVSYSVPDFDKPLQLANIPHGEYSYRMFLTHRILGDRPWEGTIHHQGDTTSISTSVSQFGAIDVSILEGEGERRHSTTLLKLVPQFPGYEGRFTFLYPPFRLEAVPAGDYIIQVFSKPMRGVVVVESPIVTVRPGEVLEQTLSIPD